MNQYIIYKLRPCQEINLDGNLETDVWKETPFSNQFVDIYQQYLPKFETKMKIRWDNENLYIGAYLEETQIWARLTENNSVIYQDNDFEVFIDTDGSNHNYKEIEINALNKVWALMLNKPYVDGGSENSKRVDSEGFDFNNIQTGCFIDGEVNNPLAKNKYWSLTIKLPIKEIMFQNILNNIPQEGCLWRANFSRVQWKVDDQYNKISDVEDNWVWQQQGQINMHLPEKWGILQFTECDNPSISIPKIEYKQEEIRNIAMDVYYQFKSNFQIESFISNHQNYQFNLFKNESTYLCIIRNQQFIASIENNRKLIVLKMSQLNQFLDIQKESLFHQQINDIFENQIKI